MMKSSKIFKLLPYLDWFCIYYFKLNASRFINWLFIRFLIYVYVHWTGDEDAIYLF